MTFSSLAISVQNVQKRFMKDGNAIEVLRNISLSVPKGESLAIVGQSGCGKSTLLQIIGTLLRPSAGDIQLLGQSTLQKNDAVLAQFRQKHLGFVFQFHHLLPDFSALENVMMPMLLNGTDLSSKQIKNKAENILHEVGLEHRLTHKPSRLSGGEQQRVAIARAMINQPDIILADEPSGNLDERTGSVVSEILLNEVEKRGCTLIIVTHNNHLAKLCNRVLRLSSGQLNDEIE